MKAKEIAASILMHEPADQHAAAVDAVSTLVIEAFRLAKQRNNTQSMMACFRESFSKWKAVVAEIKRSNPDVEIEEYFYPKAFAITNPRIFAMCMKEKIFLGYVADEQDRKVAAQGEMEIENEMLRERLETLQRQSVFTGDAQAFFKEARRMGIIR